MKNSKYRTIRELHETQENRYNDTKNMTFKELTMFINEKTEKVMKKYAFDKESIGH